MYMSYKEYKNNNKYLYVRVQLFEEKSLSNTYFCGQPYMYLVVWQENTNSSARFGIGDMDDYDYEKDLENPSYELLHEIINWMKDHEYASVVGFEDVEKFLSIV